MMFGGGGWVLHWNEVLRVFGAWKIGMCIVLQGIVEGSSLVGALLRMVLICGGGKPLAGAKIVVFYQLNAVSAVNIASSTCRSQL